MKLFLNVESNKEMYDTVLLTFKPDHLIYTHTHNNPYILAERPENEITLMFPQDITLYIFWHKLESIVYHFPYKCNKKNIWWSIRNTNPLYPSTVHTCVCGGPLLSRSLVLYWLHPLVHVFPSGKNKFITVKTIYPLLLNFI